MTPKEYEAFTQECGPKPIRHDTINGRPAVFLDITLSADHDQSVPLGGRYPEPANVYERAWDWCCDNVKAGWSESSFYDREAFTYVYSFGFEDALDAARFRAEFGV